jgi:hypothetical protein
MLYCYTPAIDKHTTKKQFPKLRKLLLLQQHYNIIQKAGEFIFKFFGFDLPKYTPSRLFSFPYGGGVAG